MVVQCGAGDAKFPCVRRCCGRRWQYQVRQGVPPSGVTCEYYPPEGLPVMRG